jgi:hypothetical protein
MPVQVEIAWISAASVVGGALVGVAGAVIAAGIGLRSARRTTAEAIGASSADIRAQIEAGSADVKARLAAASADIKAQIEADQSNRVWEKQAAAYTDAIEGIFHRQRTRQAELRSRIDHSETTPRTSAPVDWPALEAQLIAYSSPAVLDAFRAAAAAGSKFDEKIKIWDTYSAFAVTPLRPPRPGGER